MNNVIIIGTGLAGLSAANELLDNNIQPIIIDAGIIGTLKVCGEFFSYECHDILKKWNIEPYNFVEKIKFITEKSSLELKIPKPCASMNRSKIEIELYQRAVNLGATFHLNTKVINIVPAEHIHDCHSIELSNQENLKCKYLIIAAGRLNCFNAPNLNSSPNYIGIKNHFRNVQIDNDLYMYMGKNFYMGVAHIDANLVNICCLLKIKEFEKYKNPNEFIRDISNKYEILNNQLKNSAMVYDKWLIAPVYNFGKKSIKNWPNSYFIGDAAGSIYPASGDGLAMGITSGVMAAQHICSKSKKIFYNTWQKRYSSRFYFAKIMHTIFISPKIYYFVSKLIHFFPSLSTLMYKLTRG